MSLAGSIIQGAGTLGASAISSGVNLKNQQSANRTNLQIAQDTNQTNRDIATETNQANQQLAQQQFEHEKEMWNMNNAYNDPSAQVQRIQSAGINPLTAFSNGGNAGNSSAPPVVPEMANQVTGAPMVAASVDPLTMDNSIAESILAYANNMTNRYNADTARLKANSDINVNEWSVKSVQQQIENWKTQQSIDLTMLPYLLREKESVIADNRASRKLKDKQREAVDTTIDIGKAQIFKSYADVVGRFLEIDIMQQNADINQQNADSNRMNAESNAQNARTNAESVANSYDIALKEFGQKNLQQLLDFAKNFSFDSSHQTLFGGSAGLGSRGSNLGLNASESNTDNHRSVNVERAVEEYGKLCALNVKLLEYIGNPGISPKDKQSAIEAYSRTSRLMSSESPYLLHKIRSEGITRGSRLRSLQFPVDGYANPMNQSSFP